MQNKKLTERIRALGKLTPSESKIADYFHTQLLESGVRKHDQYQ